MQSEFFHKIVGVQARFELDRGLYTCNRLNDRSPVDCFPVCGFHVAFLDWTMVKK